MLSAYSRLAIIPAQTGEVLKKICVVQGVQACNIGAPILAEEYAASATRRAAMTGPMLMVFGILAGAIVLFAWGRPRADIVAILVVLALMLSRVLTRCMKRLRDLATQS